MQKAELTRWSARHRTVRLIATLLTLFAVAGLAGCGGRQESLPGSGGPVLAHVNDDKLTKADLDSLAPEGYEFDENNLRQILDKWVSNSLMYQEALRRGLNKKPSVIRHLKRLEHDYLVNELLEELTADARVSAADVMAYYNLHRDEFSYEVKIQRIIVPDSMLAVQTLADIKAGADFTKLAKERSRDMLLEGGQESRYFARDVGDPRMGGDPNLAEVIFALAPGQVSDVVKTQEGYQVVKLVDRKKVKAETSLADAKDQIEAVLNYRRSQALVDSILSELRARAKIEVKPDAYFAEPDRK
jgi:parvulin-like peptidyl-prolyl isomerase